MAVDLPLNLQQSHISCIASESSRQSIPAALILSVLKTENGAIGQAKRNTNGTFDYGPMQINTVWINEIAKASGSSEYLAESSIRSDFCSNIAAGAWILRKKIESTGNMWRGVAHYHSKNEAFGTPYAWRVYSNLSFYGGLNALRLKPGVVDLRVNH